MDLKQPTVMVTTEVPVRLHTELEALVHAGLARDLDGIVLDALTRYVESHGQALHEEFLHEDVEWGLWGSD